MLETAISRSALDYCSCDHAAIAESKPDNDEAPELWSNVEPRPESVAGYRILEEIGSGAMSCVYRAEGPDGQHVAIKIQDFEALIKPWAARRFECEAEITSLFDHPSIVSLFDSGTLDDGRGFLVLEMVEGTSLKEHIGSHGMALETALETFAEISEALATVHEAGVVHGDLKPQNIMIDGNGRPRLIDFGLALRLQTDDGSEMPEGSLAGTPAYMSPEQIESRTLDCQSDVFALGTLLYTMLSGKTPFRRKTMLGVLSAIVHDEPEDLLAWRGDLCPAVAGVVHKALTKGRRKRFGSVCEMMKALEKARCPATVHRMPWWRLVAATAASLGWSAGLSTYF